VHRGEETKVHRQTRRAGHRGLTLIGICTSLAIVGLLAAAALRWIQQSRAEVIAEALSWELVGSLRYASNQAVARNERVQFSFYESRAGGCYLVHTGDRGDCWCDNGSGLAQCDNGAEALEAVFQPAGEPVRLAASFSSIVFNAGSGTTAPGSAVCVVPAAGKARRHVVDDTGRVHPCPPVASNDVCERC
jgi:type IV fimbrial biogenesis protein FimT